LPLARPLTPTPFPYTTLFRSFRHAATALVNARTARVMIAADPAPDPIAQSWMTAFPNAADYRAPTIARELTTTPWSPIASDSARSEEHTSELQSRGHLVCRIM